ncbi:sodium-coupled monocarboxylate transporter 1-like [Hyposmocoma kahamanoa]|nr:sodium-coupled monocarboxylate transporter 1-like [Hyposmocoma kahamanoa]
MVLVSGAFIIQATVKSGGPVKVVHDNLDGGRLQFMKFTWDPTVRVDTTSALIGQLFMSVSIYGCQQTFVQRYCSMSSESRVRKTLLANVPAVAILFSLSWIVGMAIYSLYKNCDPYLAGNIAAPDEVLAFYVQDQFTFLPGMLGLFLGSIFNGALSFMVSNVNSLATVTWEDFASAIPVFKGIDDKKQLMFIKVIGVFYSLLIMTMSLGVGMVGGVVEVALLVTSATSGALLGVFLLAALFPIANGKGAICGMITSHMIASWLTIGRILYTNQKNAMLPLSVEGCSNDTVNIFSPKPLPVEMNQTLFNVSPILQTTMSSPIENSESITSSILMTMYSISYMWYAVIGTISCVIIGNLIGALTASEKDAFDKQLLHPLAARIASKLPGRKRTYTVEKKEPSKDSEKTEDTTVEDLNINNDKTPSFVSNEKSFVEVTSPEKSMSKL